MENTSDAMPATMASMPSPPIPVAATSCVDLVTMPESSACRSAGASRVPASSRARLSR